MSFQDKYTQVIGALESVPGTAETIDTTDFDVAPIQESIENDNEVEFDDENAKEATGFHYETKSVSGVQMGTVSFNCYWRYSGTANLPVKQSKFLQACGTTEVINTSIGVDWEPKEVADITTMTIEIHRRERGSITQHIVDKLAGCMGNCIISCEGVGKPIIAQYTFSGKVVSNADAASAIALNTLDSGNPEKFILSPNTILGTSLLISSWQLDFGNVVEPKLDGSEASGFDSFQISEKHPRFSCDPYMDRVATFDAYGKQVAMTTGQSFITIGADDHLAIHIPNGQILTKSNAVREGLSNWDINIKCLNNGVVDSDIDAQSTFQIAQGTHA